MTQSIASLAASATSGTTATSAAEKAKLKSAAQAFEAVFLRQMMGSMRSASLGDGMFDSQATQTFQDMSDSKTADAMAGKGVLGIAKMLETSLGGAIPQVKAAEMAVSAGTEVAHRVGGVVSDLASRFKL